MARRHLASVLGALALAACAHGCRQRPADRASPGGAESGAGQQDAATLGRDIYELVDRAADYQGSHRGRAAGSFREIGVDSLTPETIRRLSVTDGTPTVTVLFRRPRGRAIAGCWGDRRILEEAALRGGRFTLSCSSPASRVMTFEVGGPIGR